jgi:hypothetical protein
MKKFFTFVLVLGLVVCFDCSAFAESHKHIRVALDLSKSLSATNQARGWPTDSGRLLILSTILLYDLVQPNVTTGDTFEIYPFDSDWACPNAEFTQVSDEPSIVAEHGKRDELIQKIKALQYDRPCTFFYPAIRRGLEDLTKFQSVDDAKVIFLLTDGVPESDTMNEEKQAILQELIPELKKRGIRLYVLAFGKEAFNNQDFFKPVNDVGGFEAIPDNSDLLASLVKIFSRSFGFTVDAPQALPVKTLDLAGRVNPERVAVIVLSHKRSEPPPQLTLEKPQGCKFTDPYGIVNASVSGASYSLQWILRPEECSYPFSTDISDGTVTILRPTALSLELFPSPPKTVQIAKAMAEAPLELQVLVRPGLGLKGDPGDVNIFFQIAGKGFHFVEKSTCKNYEWCEREQAGSNKGVLTDEGRLYTMNLEFPKNFENPHERYTGFIEVFAKKEEATVASLEGAKAHVIEIYPYLEIAPDPLDFTIPQTLEKGQVYCAKFKLRVNNGYLPHSQNSEYSLSAFLSADKELIQRELYMTNFELDGQTLEFETQKSEQPGYWNKGVKLNENALLGERQLCIKPGKPKRNSTSEQFEAKVKFILNESPYNDFNVIKDFTLKLRVAPPPVWQWYALSIASLLGLIALFWYGRGKPTLHPALGYAFASVNDPNRFVSRKFEDRLTIRHLLGLTIKKPITAAENDDRILAWVCPVKDAKDLYRLQLAKGVQIESTIQGETMIRIKNRYDVQVHRIYRLSDQHESYWFRLEYS